jgi:hypothetical protein
VLEGKLRSLTGAAAVALALLATAIVPTGAGALRANAKRLSIVSATLTQCVTSVTQAERSATFAGEMSVVPGTAKMAMRIDVEERLPHEESFHAVIAPGADVWRTSEPHVKIFKYLKQVTDLSAPARYRALVHYRWMNAHGVTIRRAARVTHACAQPAAPPESPATA